MARQLPESMGIAQRTELFFFLCNTVLLVTSVFSSKKMLVKVDKDFVFILNCTKRKSGFSERRMHVNKNRIREILMDENAMTCARNNN